MNTEQYKHSKKGLSDRLATIRKAIHEGESKGDEALVQEFHYLSLIDNMTNTVNYEKYSHLPTVSKYFMLLRIEGG